MSDLKPVSWNQILEESKRMKLGDSQEFLLDHDVDRGELSRFVVDASEGRDEVVGAIRNGRNITVSIELQEDY